MSDSAVTLLIRLSVRQRFRTDSDRLHGVERLAITFPDQKMLEHAYSPLQPLANHSLGLIMVFLLSSAGCEDGEIID